jgi:thermostable 8-oxoguanine DNA glycosylase
MIDPFKITNYDRTLYQLQEFWLFTLCAAGKTAYVQAEKLHQFLKLGPKKKTPFQKVRHMIEEGTLEQNLRTVGLGQYKKLTRAFEESLSLNVRKATVDDLEKIYGVSYKSSRFFILHSRQSNDIAAIDTHIMKYLKSLGYNYPKTHYPKWEQAFIEEAKKAGKTIADYDLYIWSLTAKRKKAA